MIEGIIIFIIGFVCGHYTDQVKSFCKNLINKFTNKDNNENI